MIRDSVSVLVIGASSGLQDVLDCVSCQTRQPDDVCVVEQPTHRLSQTMRAALAAKGGAVVSASDGATEGQIRNVGVAATHGTWLVLLDPRDRIEPTYLERVLDFAVSAAATFVTTSSRAPDTSRGASTAARLTAADLITRPDGIYPASLFRRDGWQAVGGFDERLDGWVDHDFWLRLLGAGGVGAAMDEPLLVSRAAEADERAERDPDARRRSLETVVEKHRLLFADQLPAIIGGWDRQLEDSRNAGYRLDALRAAGESELATLRNHVDEATVSLQRTGRNRVEFGDFHRVTPISSVWGSDRGRCVDRYYIEQFLEVHAEDVRGRVLEVHDDDYTRQFGGARVTHSDVIDINPMNRRATVIDDLRDARSIASQSYDCFIMTQTLHVIYDMRAVIREASRVVAPGGVVLATLACLSRLAPEQGLDGDFWRFTASAARRSFGEFFPNEKLEIRAYGNVLVDIAYLYGLACHELSEREFETHDPYFPLIIGVRAQV